MTKDEALRLAIESLCCVRDMVKHPDNLEYIDHQVAKIEAALEAKDEPVAWMNDSTPSGIFARHMEGAKNFGCTIPLYTTPPQRKPLTEQEIGAILEDINAFGTRLYTFARAIEAAHGIKGEA